MTTTNLTISGLWRRAAAATFDSCLGVTISIGVVFTLALAMGPTGYYWGLGVALLLWLLYSTGCESSDLQSTLGGRIFGLKVTDLNGQRLSFWRASLRQVARLLPAVFVMAAIEAEVNWLIVMTVVFAFAGFVIAAFNRQRQSIFDMVAKSLVYAR